MVEEAKVAGLSSSTESLAKSIRDGTARRTWGGAREAALIATISRATERAATPCSRDKSKIDTSEDLDKSKISNLMCLFAKKGEASVRKLMFVTVWTT